MTYKEVKSLTKEQIIKSIECCEADFCAGCPIDNNNGDCRVKMAEYKDVELLKKQIADFKRAVNSVKPMNSDYLTGYISALSVVEGAIAEQPATDVMEVVRCKDCKHYSSNKPKSQLHRSGYCLLNEDVTDDRREETDFCSYGERKEFDNG